VSDRRSTDRPWGDGLTLAKLLPTRESGHLVEKRSSKAASLVGSARSTRPCGRWKVA
jgi:hypothetical protein